ncbi:uncharacterized protein FOMMEDRAFT_30607 [Fomitiporia mediterranea MF3/22]|uniref:uncharacterized protein n=1 Tax=Fomitiporia mediterranea (strain MF3/22) TaxID=694068 RepID=UPI0004407BDD|nr:uncharacterized protein FOMMEDRAFT_30607 [Fomitiporia mediterranea MF3/22]EJD00639.1 hypothetical protein FOMMEDRAFT_30607 [Fomitiporia mediterranea MF3/22]
MAVAFIIMPATTQSYTVEAFKGQAAIKQLRDTVSDIQIRHVWLFNAHCDDRVNIISTRISSPRTTKFMAWITRSSSGAAILASSRATTSRGDTVRWNVRFEEEEEEEDFAAGVEMPPFSTPGSLRLRAGMATPGDTGMQGLSTSNYRGTMSLGKEEEEEGYPCFERQFSSNLTKVRSRANSIRSGASTPGGGAYNSLSERDLQETDVALSHVNESQEVKANGAY